MVVAESPGDRLEGSVEWRCSEDGFRTTVGESDFDFILPKDNILEFQSACGQ